jgi:Ser/Thr protein kinase RdoA (MazF antagonist)
MQHELFGAAVAAGRPPPQTTRETSSVEIGGELLAQAVLHFSLDVTSFAHLGGLEATAIAALRDGQRVVLKLTQAEGDSQQMARTAERCKFAIYLAQHGVPVARPLPANDGRWAVPMTIEGSQYVAYLTTRAPGQHVNPRDPAVWNGALFCRWGEIMGHMHALAQSYPLWRQDGGIATTLTGWRHEHAFFHDWCQDDQVRSKWQELERQLSELPLDRRSYGLVHNDFHPHNFRVEGRQITLFDFDVCSFHWFAKDLAIPLFFADWQRPPNLRQPFHQYMSYFYAQFMSGYQRHHRLDPFWLEQLPLFLKHHQMLLFIVFSDLWGDSPQRWQARQLGHWRAAIITGMPVFNFPLTSGEG